MAVAPAEATTGAAGGLADGEIERYARHIVLREIGGEGQQKLKRASVLVVGAGGLGSPVLFYLAAAGVGTITVIDDDAVARSNLQRQIVHAEDRVGMAKVASAALALAALNPFVAVEPVHARLDAALAADLVPRHDLVLDGTDNFATRHMVNESCVRARVPLIAAAIAQWEGQLSLYDPARGAPCFACVFPDIPAPGLAPPCSEIGVMGALPGILGAMMAAEAIKELTGAGRSLRGRLLLHDALWGESREIAVRRRAGCAVCGGKNVAFDATAC